MSRIGIAIGRFILLAAGILAVSAHLTLAQSEVKPGESIDQAQTANERGVTHFRVGEFTKAAELFQLAIHLNPRLAHAYNNLGATYNELGQYRRAIELLNRAIALSPGYAEAYNNLGTALAETGHLKEAINKLEQAIALEPELADAHYNIAVVFLRVKKREAALEQYRLLVAQGVSQARRLHDVIYKDKVLSLSHK